MRVFLTGSTGFVGSQVALELIQAGHQVLGLTRSDAGEAALLAIGAQAHRGDIEDLPSLVRGTADCDAVIHTAFDHDFANFVANCEKDARVIAALGGALRGSQRPLLITSGTPMGSPGPGLAAVEDHFNPEHPNPRAASEIAGHALLESGVNVVVVRLSQIHNTVKQGLVTELIAHARHTGISAYVGEGTNCWSAAHVSDAARLYRLALETHQPGARYHATAESRIAFREIAQTIGLGLGVPVVALTEEKAAAHFGWLAMFAGRDMAADSEQTKAQLGWQPTGVGLLEDIAGCLKG